MNLGHYMAKIADPNISAKRELAFLKQKPAKQKQDVLSRLQREGKPGKKSRFANDSGEEGLLTEEQRKQ